MRVYEIVTIFSSNLGEDEITAKVEGFNQLLAKSDGAEVLVVEPWGTRQLAYPINKVHKAHYVLMNIECGSDTIEPFADKNKPCWALAKS